MTTDNAKPMHNLGDIVFVLCRHRYWGAPSMMQTVITGKSFDANGENLRFAAFDADDIVVEVFSLEHEVEARQALADAIEFQKTHRQRGRRE